MVKIPEWWKETTLKSVCVKAEDKINVSDLTNETYISTENMLVDKGWITTATTLPTITNVSKFFPWDILFSNIRTYFKKLYLSNFTWWCSNDVLIFRANKETDNKFLFYNLSYDTFFDYTVKTSKWTKMPRWDKNAIEKFWILLPPFPEQQAIASVLSSFDDKIELLREENQTLEEMWQTLFKERFGKYKVWDELIKAEKVLNFERWIEVWSDNYFNTKDTLNNPIYFYRVWDIINNWNRSQIYCEKELLNNKIFKETDVLVSFDWSVWRVFVWGKGWFSTWLRKIFSKDNTIKNSFIYFWANSEYVQNTISLYSEWTTIQHASKAIPNLEIVKSLQEINKITEQFDTVFNKIISNLEEINTLTSTRDQLLPKLMSWEVRVEF